jgi:citrate lyase subunit beta / citryl-CoA lyase
MDKQNKLPTTYLFVPANRPDRYAKAFAAGAGAVVVDLEDAVSSEDKALARQALGDWCNAHRDLAAKAIIRINDETTAWFEDDLVLAKSVGIGGVMLPKAELASQIGRVKAALGPGSVMIPIVETARGLLNVDAVAAAAGVQRLAFGTLDYAVDLDLSGDPRGLIYPACRMALASRAAGLAAPIAGVTASLADDAALLSDLAFARACGFTAKLCIHPKQVVLIRQALIPSTHEVEWAQRVIAAASIGKGAVQVDGKMVDRPVVLKAQAILDRIPA